MRAAPAGSAPPLILKRENRMKKIQSTTLAAAITLGLSLGFASAQTSTPGGSKPGVNTTTPAAPTSPAVQAGTGTRNAPSNSKTSALDRSDRKFIVDAAGDGMFEVEIAKLATTKATSPEVKSFASTMVEDHTKANGELAQLANAKGVELPAAPPRGKRRDIEKMGKLSGEKFDREFAHEVGMDDHKKNISKFEKASKNAKDPELKAWVDKTLPTLRAHLDAAAKLPQNAKGNKG
jgi:putative membrane protein